MHPYYVSDRLVSASPTLIESVETQETEMITPNNGMGMPGQMPPNHPGAVPTMGLAINSSPISPTGVLGSQYPGVQYPMLSPQPNPTFPSPYQPTSVIRHATNSSGPRAYPSTALASGDHGFGVYGIAGPNSGSSNGYLPTSLPYIPVATSMSSSTPYLPVATSTPFVQFATPNFTTSESLYTYTNKGYTPQVSFHFQSPTFSTPPIQMMAPDSRGTPLSWQHTVPTSMPWAATSVANIHFTATDSLTTQSSTSMVNSTSNPKRLFKRKSSSNDRCLPEKIHVNEERMAARLEELHLDNNNLQWHPDLEDQWYTQRPPPRGNHGTNDAEKEKENQAGVSQQVTEAITSDTRLNFTELLKIGIKSQEMLPKLILDEITKPCMQVVLWKPPGNFVHDLVRDAPLNADSMTPPPDDASEINDIDNPSSGTSSDVMDTALLTSPSSSWSPAVKDMDDMEL